MSKDGIVLNSIEIDEPKKSYIDQLTDIAREECTTLKISFNYHLSENFEELVRDSVKDSFKENNFEEMLKLGDEEFWRETSLKFLKKDIVDNKKFWNIVFGTNDSNIIGETGSTLEEAAKKMIAKLKNGCAQ
ncbi:MAG TPA: hypothetical protein VGK47_04525 [Nitrososphaeraceae archaeon]